MYCKKCGTQIADDSVFCSVCGTKQDHVSNLTAASADVSVQPQPAPVAPPPPTHTVPEEAPTPSFRRWLCPHCHNMIDKEPCIVCAKGPQTPIKPFTNEDHTYLCPTCGTVQRHHDYCHNCGQLFAEQTKNTPEFSMKYYKFCVYFRFIAGAIYDFILGLLYLTGTVAYGLSAEIDAFYGLIVLAQGVFLLIVRDQLLNYKKDAITWLITTFVIILSINLVFGFSLYTSTLPEMLPIYLLSMGGTVAFNVLEIVYFKKREILFVN